MKGMLPQSILASVVLLLFGAMALAETSVTVTITAPEAVRLPPDTELDVRLLDVSLMDVAAVVISSRRVAADRFPVTLVLEFDPKVIEDRNSYSVSATLYDQRKMILRSTSAHPVLTRGHGPEVTVSLQDLR